MSTVQNTGVRVLCFDVIGAGGALTLEPQNFLASLREEGSRYEEAWESYRSENEYGNQHESMYRQRFFRKWGGNRKFTVLRDKASGELIFCFVLKHNDTDVYMLSLYARIACMRNKLTTQTGDGILEQVLIPIANARASEDQFDWIGYGHFWHEWGRSDLGLHNKLGIDFSCEHMRDEGRPYWHEALADTVRQQLAEYFHSYVCFTMAFVRQSWPVCWDEEKAIADALPESERFMDLLDY